MYVYIFQNSNIKLPEFCAIKIICTLCINEANKFTTDSKKVQEYFVEGLNIVTEIELNV